MRLLLHTCCAPCAVYPLKTAAADGYDEVVGFFYNPNIHPAPEYRKRMDTAALFFDHMEVNMMLSEYRPDIYFRGMEQFDRKDGRCYDCWWLRLKETAAVAGANGFDAFTTTLLASPYQRHDIIKVICEGLSSDYGISFYYRDFRAGFKQSHIEARSRGMYCQRYCGCAFSLIEREERKPTRLVGA